MYSKLRRILLLVFLSILIISYFIKNNYKTVDNIRPEVLQAPLQSVTDNNEPIKFSKDGFAYDLTPVAEYQIQALVVHRMDYRFFSIYNSDSVFPVDLCLTWGDNLENKSYQNKYLSFSQDARFCFYKWRGETSINPDLISNNHLIANDKKILSVINKIKAGDQVSISGYLVNVEANKTGKVSDYDPNSFSLTSSLTRTDSGGGACEIIYIKDIKIIQVGHPIWSFLFNFSLWALIGLIFLNIILIITPKHNYRPNRNE
ncbi:MAG TPA: hypothetical protein VFD16_03930 [Candidatus Saccharimonadales bacterium]|nr:hypothetical protein [Candidatus Saccharimonadales bacterium]